MKENLQDIREMFKKNFVPISDEESDQLDAIEKKRELNENMKRKAEVIKRAKLNPKKLKLAEFSLFPDFAFYPDYDYKFTGPIGTGKTLLSHAIAKYYLRQNKKVLLLDKYRVIEAAYAISMNQMKMSDLIEDLDLLILDDFGQVDLTAKQLEIMNFVIGERAEHGFRTLITGNFSIEDLIEDTTVARMSQTYQFITFTGESKREPLDAEDVLLGSKSNEMTNTTD